MSRAKQMTYTITVEMKRSTKKKKNRIKGVKREREENKRENEKRKEARKGVKISKHDKKIKKKE